MLFACYLNIMVQWFLRASADQINTDHHLKRSIRVKRIVPNLSPMLYNYMTSIHLLYGMLINIYICCPNLFYVISMYTY